MRGRSAIAAVLLAATLLAAGCGGSSDSSGETDPLTVSAAASLTDALPAYSKEVGIPARFSFAGSDDLAAQIRKGAPVDVFAAANTDLPDMLYDEGLVEKPTVFATNSLVIAVPKDSGINSIEDLAAPGVDLIIGTKDVPFGSYTRETLDRIPAGLHEAILANVRSEESDVKAAIGKLTQGAADAAFTYVTDVAAASDQLKAIELPVKLQPDVALGVAVVKDSDQLETSREFASGLTTAQGRQVLESYGFKPPVRGGS